MKQSVIPITKTSNDVSLYINWLDLYNIGYCSAHHHIIKHKMECTETDVVGTQHCTAQLSSIDTDRLLSIGINKEYDDDVSTYYIDIAADTPPGKPKNSIGV